MRRDPVSAAVWEWRPEGEAAAERRAGEARRARRQGVVRGAVGLAVAALIWWLWQSPAAAVVAAIALAVAALALASPLGAYRGLDVALGHFAHWVGTAVTWLLLPVLYLVVFLPVGVLLRLRRRLRLTRKPDPALASYWVRRSEAPAGAETHQRQF